MPLSTKLVADYTEAINDILDQLVKTEDEFSLAIEALQNINNNDYNVPPVIQEHIKAIKERITEPEDYVQDEADCEEYKNIIQRRIDSKIKELQSLTKQQKSESLKNKEQQLAQRAEYQQTINGRVPPSISSEAHTVSEEEMLRQTYGGDGFFERQPSINRHSDFHYRIQADDLQIALLDLEDDVQIELRLRSIYYHLGYLVDYPSSDIFPNEDIHNSTYDERFLRHCTYILEHVPAHIETMRLRAIFYELHGDALHALDDYQKILSIEPENEDAIESVARLQSQQSSLTP